MTKKVISVGFVFPGNQVENIPLTSDRSLLDADIIVFEPSWESEYHSYESYKGKPLLNETDSFKVVEDAAHWRSEIKAAYEAGKTVIIFLSRFDEFYVHTGNKEFSGTGRNRAVTNLVSSRDNYSFLPISFDHVVPATGTEIKVAKDLKYLAPYWKEFAEYSVYEVYIEGKFPNVILTTKAGNRIIGTVFSNQKGVLILLPPLRYDMEQFVSSDEKTGSEVWTRKAIAFGKSLLSHLVGIDNALRSNREITPSPEWTKKEEYRFDKEAQLEQEIRLMSKNIEDLQNVRSKLRLELESAGQLRRLLYEKGHLLEDAISEALLLMEFQAERFKDAESEFDVVFTSPEGRFLGEAEGKDNAAINIDKLSQLERNLQEDFAREEVKEYAHGVLFGNAYRLLPIMDRPDFFTEKCTSGAKRAKIALVRTPDLFIVAKYLKEHSDADFAKRCRQAIFASEGDIVQFPIPPSIVETIGDEKVVP